MRWAWRVKDTGARRGVLGGEVGLALQKTAHALFGPDNDKIKPLLPTPSFILDHVTS